MGRGSARAGLPAPASPEPGCSEATAPTQRDRTLQSPSPRAAMGSALACFPQAEFEPSLTPFELCDLGQPTVLSRPVLQSEANGTCFPEFSLQSARMCERAVQTLKVYTGEVCEAMGEASVIFARAPSVQGLFRVPGNLVHRRLPWKGGAGVGPRSCPTREVGGNQVIEGQSPIGAFGKLIGGMRCSAKCTLGQSTKFLLSLGGAHLWASEAGAPHFYA